MSRYAMDEMNRLRIKINNYIDQLQIELGKLEQDTDDNYYSDEFDQGRHVGKIENIKKILEDLKNFIPK